MKGFTSLIISLMWLLLVTTGHTAIITVNTLSSAIVFDGYCSLPEAITAANTNNVYRECLPGEIGMDIIQFAGNVTGTITLSAALPVITEDLVITGPGAGVLTINGSDGAYHIFEIDVGVSGQRTVTIIGMTLTGAGSNRNAIIVQQYSNLYLSDSIVTENNGTGILNDGTNVHIDDSEISWNRSSYDGGGIYNRGYIYLSNTIIANNSAQNGGGIAHQFDGYIWIRNGSIIRDNTAADWGGGIYQWGGRIDITHSTIGPGNQSFSGGGIYNSGYLNNTNSGFLVMSNSTLSGNTAAYGGGIFRSVQSVTGRASLANVTITNNRSTATAEPGGGGLMIDALGGPAPAGTYIGNSILAGNHVNTASGATGPDCVGMITSSGYNIIGNSEECFGEDTSDQLDVDPMLGPLQDNGGPTLTHALLVTSPAIDAANPTGCLGDHDQDPLTPSEELTQDQRGDPRPLDGDADGTTVCDSGAYEFLLPQEIEVSDSIAPSDDLQMDFGEVSVGNSKSEIITVSNIGGQPLQITNVQLIGPDIADFNFDLMGGASPCGALVVVLNGSDSCTVRVNFVPQTEGNKTLNIQISTNDENEPTVDITLTGTSTPKADDTGDDTSTGGGGGGCTINNDASFDPLLILFVLLSSAYLLIGCVKALKLK